VEDFDGRDLDPGLAKYIGKWLSIQYKLYEQTKPQGPKLAIDKVYNFT